MATAPQREPVTIEYLLAHPEIERVELIRGTIIEKAGNSPRHSSSQVGLSGSLFSPFQRSRGGPGGWRFFTELDVQFGRDLLVPDVCGFRRDHVPEFPPDRPVKLTPDWVCEILSQSNESHDRVEKLEIYFRSGVPHYWIINPVEGTLEVFRRTDLAFALVLTAHKGQRVHAEPFDAVELSVDELLGADT